MALHEVQLKGYSVRPGNLSLGTFDSYGIEQLHVTLDDTWSGLAIDATFHNAPNDKGVTMLLDTDGLVTVPPEACKQPSKYATITFRGVQDGVQRISCNLPYVVLDHAQVPGANSTATPSENAQALAQMQALRDGAVDAKNQAKAARDDAARSAVAAKEYETNAGQSATAAKTAQSAAETAKAGAETAQKAAASSASSASTFASTATTQAAAAKSSATAAKASEKAAGKSAQGAAASESAAKAAQTAAETAKANADTAASNAAAKATAAAKSAVAAKESETSAGQSATAAANSATAAAASATAAAGDAKTASDAAAGAADAKAAAVAAQKDATASKAAAANSSAAAKTSEDAAAKSAADADSTANSINNSMMQIAANKEAISQLKEDTAVLQKHQNVLVGSEAGNPISCNDAFTAPLCGLTVYGRSTQDGTPTPDAPVPIVSAGDSGTIVLTLGDGDGKTQTITLPTPNGLPGIPVASGGNYTDQNGQQWVCDEVDLERGVKVQRVKRVDISSLDKSYWKFRDDVGANVSATKYSNKAAIIDFRTSAPAMSNILPAGVGNSKNTFRLVATPLYLYQFNLDSSEFPTVKSWVEYLEANTVFVIYATVTPIEMPLTDAEIAAYKALTAYAPDTVAQASDDADIKLCYQRDVNLVVKNLEDAIASMTTT